MEAFNKLNTATSDSEHSESASRKRQRNKPKTAFNLLGDDRKRAVLRNLDLTRRIMHTTQIAFEEEGRAVDGPSAVAAMQLAAGQAANSEYKTRGAVGATVGAQIRPTKEAINSMEKKQVIFSCCF